MTHEDTYLNMIPYTLTHALMGDLDPGDGWKELLMAVENSHDDGPPLDPDCKAQLALCYRRMESPTEKLLSDLGQKGYRVYHLRKWLRAQGRLRAVDLLEGGDKATGRMSVQRSQSASSETWMYKPSKYHRSQSVVVKGGGKTVDIPNDQLTTYGDHADGGVEGGGRGVEGGGGGGGGGTIELGFDAVTSFDSIKQPEVGASKSEGACVVPNRSEGSGVSESPSGPKGADDVDGPSESERADMAERSGRSEVANATESRREPESTDMFDRPSKPEDANVVKESKNSEGVSAVSGPNYESISRVNPSHLNSKPATFRMRTEAGADSVSPPEDGASFEKDGGPYHQHRLVGSETVRQRRETTASGGGDGSSPKEEANDTNDPKPLPAAPPSSHSGVGKCTICITLLVVASLWVATLAIALYILR